MLAPVAIGLDPLRDRLDPLPGPDRRGDGGVDVGPDAGRNTAEKRGAEGGAGVDRDALERQLEDRGDDPQPLLAAGAAAGDPSALRRGADLAEQVERVAEPERDALEHRPDEGAAIVAQPESDEGTAGIGVGVRGALAGEVGQEQQALAPRRPGGGGVDELAVAAVRGHDVVQPAQRAGRRHRHPHGVPGAGDRVAEGLDAGASVGLEALLGGEDDAGGPEHDRRRARAIDADAEGARGLVAGAGRDRGAVGGLPAERLALVEGRQEIGLDGQRPHHLLAPAPACDVEQERAGGVGDVARALAAQAQADVVLRQQDVGDSGVELGLVAAHPEELRRREARERPVSGQRDQPLEADRRLDLAAFDAGSPVVPEDRRAQGPVAGVERD